MTWPDRERWRAYLRFILLFYLFFFPIYLGGGQFAAASGRAVGLYLPWEAGLPLLPWMVWPYLSLYSIFLLPLFHLAPDQMARLTRQFVLVLLVAGAAFVLLPMRLGYPDASVSGWHAAVFGVIRGIDTPHNLAPSLHVACAALLLLGCAGRAAAPLAWVYRLWLVLMSAATVLVHRHHLLDVVAGLALAWAAQRLFPLEVMPAAAGTSRRRSPG